MPNLKAMLQSRSALFSLGALGGAAGAFFVFTTLPSESPPPEPVVQFAPAAQLVAVGRPEQLRLQSQVALVRDEREGVMLFAREIDTVRPIASLTKLMTALVVLEARQPLDEPLTITTDDRDRLKGTNSRLHFGAILTRRDLLRAALGVSDNRAASALARHWPGGREAFVAAMNGKAELLGMTRTHYADSSGLDPRNVSTARDLALLLEAVQHEPLIAHYTTRGEMWITDLATGRPIDFFNTNRLTRVDGWDIQLSKTGYTADAGNCLVMRISVAGRPLSVVLLNSWGQLSKYGDAARIRDWLINTERRVNVATTL